MNFCWEGTYQKSIQNVWFKNEWSETGSQCGWRYVFHLRIMSFIKKIHRKYKWDWRYTFREKLFKPGGLRLHRVWSWSHLVSLQCRSDDKVTEFFEYFGNILSTVHFRLEYGLLADFLVDKRGYDPSLQQKSFDTDSDFVCKVETTMISVTCI